MVYPLLSFHPIALLWRISTIYTEYAGSDHSLYEKSEEFYSDHFMQQTSRFDSFEEFRHESPWEMQTWNRYGGFPTRSSIHTSSETHNLTPGKT